MPGGIESRELVLLTVWGACGALVLMLGAFGVWQLVHAKRMQALPGRAQGRVTGLVKSRLLRNECQGDVPEGVLAGWGVAQGEQFWGGMLHKRVPPWFPCVSFEAGGRGFVRIFGTGAFQGTWYVGQTVFVRFDPGAPHISALEGDPSPRIAALLAFAAAAALLAAAVAVSFVL